jgi:hypothetical protein
MAKSCGTSVRGVGRLSPGRIDSRHVELVSSHGLTRRLRLSRGHGGVGSGAVDSVGRLVWVMDPLVMNNMYIYKKLWTV